MDISKEIVTVKYQTAEEYCRCCNRIFEKLEYGEIKEFDITIRHLFYWAGWKSKADVYQEEIDSSVEEYLHNTITFYSAHHSERIRFYDGEVNRVCQLVLREIQKLN